MIQPAPIQLPSRKVHSLKCWPEFFEPIGAGLKTFEVRKHDRDFRVGDLLRLEEWDPVDAQFTKRWLICFVTYLYDCSRFGVAPGYCVLGIQLPANHIWPIKNFAALADSARNSS